MSARSLSVWYTVRSEIDGISAAAAAYTTSARGMGAVAVQDAEDALPLGRDLRALGPGTPR